MSLLTKKETNDLVDILSRQAANAPMNIGSKGYYNILIQSASLDPSHRSTRIGGLIGDPESDARSLLQWADNQGTNRADPRYTTLGSLLEELLPDVGTEDANLIVSIILARNLYRDPELVKGLQSGYGVPVLAPTDGKAVEEFGPDIDWQGPSTSVELQKFWKPEPDLQDVGFLIRAIKRAQSVCRIQFENSSRVGTGFVIGKNLVLTNHHVMVDDPSVEDIQEEAKSASLHFGKVTAESGEEAKGQEFRLHSEKPVLKSSLPKKLDYALLQSESSLQFHDEIQPLPLNPINPAKGESLNILQLPAGEALQLALSGDGIVEVIPEKGLVQYSTRAISGSSGAPCFDDNWQVTALHHAQQSKAFGVVREGILINNILEEIEPYIQ